MMNQKGMDKQSEAKNIYVCGGMPVPFPNFRLWSEQRAKGQRCNKMQRVWI